MYSVYRLPSKNPPNPLPFSYWALGVDVKYQGTRVGKSYGIRDDSSLGPALTELAVRFADLRNRKTGETF